jgi:formiminotetrahydrofolate cyclodeaminase
VTHERPHSDRSASETSGGLGSIAPFLGAIGAKTPTPGGGAVASATGALGAALGSMVVAYSVGKKSLEGHRAELEAAAVSLRGAERLLMQLAEADMEAYGLVNELQKLPEADPRRVAQWPAAVAASIQAPRSTIAVATDLLRLFQRLAPMTNRYLRSDLAIAAVLADACARAGAWNVAINLSLLTDPAERREVQQQTEAAVADARARCAAVESACATE